MLTQVQLSVRPVTSNDRQKLANLIHFEVHVHRHLDWRPPLDWVGYHPYLIAEHQGRVQAALACPPDPPRVAWIRLFAVSSTISIESAWQALWPQARDQLADAKGPDYIAAIPLQRWFQTLLEESDFIPGHRVVMLNWERGKLPPENDRVQVNIRPMNLDDLPAVHEVDTASFVPVWQNSQECLGIAFKQAAFATVAEYEGRIIGYQISTATPMGGHLARLAIHPDMQGNGIGYSLLRDTLSHFERRGAHNVTVNTQQNNAASLALYKKAGFRMTGEDYPVYLYQSEEYEPVGAHAFGALTRN